MSTSVRPAYSISVPFYILDGPGTFSINAGLSRRFGFADTKALQFRFETFNLANRVNFNQPETHVDILNGATISAAKNPRLVQLGLRLELRVDAPLGPDRRRALLLAGLSWQAQTSPPESAVG